MLKHTNFNNKMIYYVIFKNLPVNKLNFNNLIEYFGALHLFLLRQTFSYKYYGAHASFLWLFNAAIHHQIVMHHSFRANTKQQSRIIFVEMHSKHITIGAEHRNI